MYSESLSKKCYKQWLTKFSSIFRCLGKDLFTCILFSGDTFQIESYWLILTIMFGWIPLRYIHVCCTKIKCIHWVNGNYLALVNVFPWFSRTKCRQEISRNLFFWTQSVIKDKIILHYDHRESEKNIIFIITGPWSTTINVKINV